ncbi:MAG: hypothetical protein ABS56_07295 [Lautropia sp. SCN 69-89]|nr:MAG: hypothetical protein ABS56_07295 [Lautropia sp. SCN 69-89]
MPSRPVYRVAAAGLDPRDVRLIEIVFKHSQYNRFEFVFEPGLVSDRLDILIVNPVEPDGSGALDWLHTLDRQVPVVSAMPRGAASSARHAISIDRLTLQLLPILNRVVEMELLASESGTPAPAAQPPSPGPQPAQRGAPPASPAPGSAAGGLQTRDFLREAARLSREGDTARQAAMHAAAPAAGTAPAQAAPATAGAARPPSNLVAFPLNGEAHAPQIRVLVVDDSPTVRKQLSLAFARMRIECDAVASAAQALERLDEHHYDLALVDVVMPDMDGYKLTRQIRRGHRGLPVIILTSRSSPFDLARGALAGCSSYLVKPVPLRQLEAAVVKHLRRSLAIDDLRGLIRLSTDPLQAPPAQQRAAATPPRGDVTAGRTPRSGG